MPEKKSAKKVAKKAAKKVAKKAAKKTPKGPGHDARRAYEHLHRLEILNAQLGRATRERLDALTQLAQAAFAQEQARSAAELLRAAEHLAFGSLAREEASTEVSELLRLELKDEYEDLLRRAIEHWVNQSGQPAGSVKALHKFMLAEAKSAWKNKAYHRALEFARGAGALAKADAGSLRLEQGAAAKTGRLPAG